MSQTRTNMNKILEKVLEQTEDEGLWFEAKTAPEAYLQSELRELHRIIENESRKNNIKEDVCTCAICGMTEEWNDNWYWFGSPFGNATGNIKMYCSAKCLRRDHESSRNRTT